MLFDERPKTKREDLFDRDEELKKIIDNINKPLIVIKGIRRIGKTSLLQVALNQVKIPYIILDCRKLRENYSRQDIYTLISEGLKSRLDQIRDILARIKGIKIMGNSIEIKWKGKDYVSIADLFDHLNEKRIIIAIDEAQRLRGPLSNEIKDAIAHAYDYDRNITFILTGSEVGLLDDFIGIENVNSPLYGRYYYSIELERFDKDKSREFLERGFQEYNVKVSDVEEIVNLLDGIPGWLTFAGNQYVNGKGLEDVRREAINIALEELKNLIGKKAKTSQITASRYLNTLKCIAYDNDSWSKVLNCLQKEEGTIISSSVFFNIIENLEKYGIIKDYQFLDPIYKEASKLLKKV